MKHLRNRVFIQILTPTALIFFSIIMTFLYYFNNSSKASTINNKSLETHNAARAINNWFTARISEMVLMSRTDELLNGNISDIKEYLKKEQFRLSFINNKIWYIETDGTYWNTNDEAGQFKNQLFIKDILIGERIFLYSAPVKVTENDKDEAIFIAMPIYDENEEIKAVLGVSILISWVKRVITYFTLNIFDEVMLVNSQGIIIVHSNDEFNGQSEWVVYGEDFAANTEYKDSLVFVSVLRNTWKIVGFIHKDDLFSQINSTNRLVITVSLLILLIISIITIGISGIIANPINNLTKMVKQMMLGDFSQKIEVNTKDELHDLASAFNLLNKRLMQLRTDDRFVFLGHLSARMAHEIRKPLNIIQLAAQSIKNQYKNECKNADLIINEINNADRFIKEILDFTKPDSINLTYYSIVELLEKVIEKFQLVARPKNIEILFKKENEIPKFYFDILQVEQVFSNIISNSIEVLSRNGKINIFILNKDDENIIIKFIDSGPGFNEGIIDKVFDPYFTTKKNGTGLGLAISYKILMGHGAKIEVGNNVNGGALVKISFPTVFSIIDKKSN